MIKKNLSGISKKSKVIAVTAFVLGLTVLGGGIASVSAAETTHARNPMGAFVSAIASKFNLNTADIQAVADEVMKTQRAEMKTQGGEMNAKKMKQGGFANPLAQAVANGKITQAQADLITTKSAELKASMEADRTANQTLTQEERKAKMEAKQTSLKEWATTNSIPEQYLRFVGGGGKGFGGPMMGHGGHGGPRLEKAR